MDRVIEELQALRAKLRVSGISLRGRQEMCANPLIRKFVQSASDAAYVCGMLRKLERCEYFKNMVGRSDQVAELYEALLAQPTLAEDLIEKCKREGFCPYEVAKDMLAQVDVVAASYIYVLDPGIRPIFLRSMGADLSDLVVVLDEAHNLPEIAVELASDILSERSISSSIREAKEFEDELALKVAECFASAMEELAAGKLPEEEEEEIVKPQEFLDLLAGELRREGVMVELPRVAELLVQIGEHHIVKRIQEGRAPRSHLRRMGGFLEKWILTSGEPQFIHLISRSLSRRGQPLVKLEVQALDPRLITRPLVEGAYATISMSGTLVPLEAYRDVVGLPQDTLTAQYPSPFPPENVVALVVRGVTTKETYRGEAMYQKLAELVAEVANVVPANVGVFTASYEVLQGLLRAGLEPKLQKPMLVEDREMSSTRNDQLIREFKAYAGRGGAVLLGVQGGRNSEGGDFPGNQMQAVVVVGIPYARPTSRSKAIVEYYESQFPGKGMFYGYYLPAHRRLCQAAGRAHRLLSDKAAIVFLDWRVATAFVKRGLSSWIKQGLEVVKAADLKARLKKFFEAGSRARQQKS